MVAETIPKLKLTYFNFGGRAEATRLALSIGKVPFEDYRFKSPEEFAAKKPSLPCGQVPILEVDDKVVCQSRAIQRYAGKLSGLYPADDLDALVVDEVIDTLEQVFDSFAGTFTMPLEERIAARKEKMLPDGPAGKALAATEEMIKRSNTKFSRTDDLTIADLCLMNAVGTLGSGSFDGVNEENFNQTMYPNIFRVRDVTKADPRVAEYYSRTTQN